MTVPKEVLDSVPQEFKHQWLYSVIPIGVKIPMRRGDENAYPLQGFLTGYCRVCDNVFSVNIPVERDGSFRMTKANVPQFGCVNPLAGL